jgi:hypothetical protein
MVLLTEAQRTRLYENVRNCSSCTRRRNLSRASRRRNFHIYIARMYREHERPSDVWRHHRQTTRPSSKKDEESQAEVDTEDEEEEEEEEEDSVSDSDSETD